MPGILWAVLTQPLPIDRRHPLGAPHHITLQYGVERTDWQHLIDHPLEAQAINESWNDRIHAIQVTLPAWVPCQNSRPHVTVSWVEGAEPVESNALLLAPPHQRPLQIPILTRIEWLEW